MARDVEFQAKLEKQAIDRAAMAMAICEGAAAMNGRVGWIGVHWIQGGIRCALEKGLLRLPEELNTP